MLRGVNGSGGGAPVGGSGTSSPSTIPRWTGPSTLGDSGLIDDSTSIYTSTRRVGVDTSTTLANVKFQVGSASALSNYQGAPFGVILPAGSGSWLELAENSASGTSFRISKDSSTGVVLTTNGKTIGFTAAGYTTAISSSQVVLTTTGNVGIGTASPQEKAQVYGNLKVGVLASGSYISLADESTTGRYVGIFRGPSDTALGVGGYSAISFTVGAAALGSQTERARIGSAGNLVMNTANTGATIQAAGSQQGLKLPATPGNGNANTLDSYQEGTRTLSAGDLSGWTYVTATQYWTLVGRTVTLHTVFTGGTSSATGGATIATPPLLTPLRIAAGAAVNSSGTALGNGVCVVASTSSTTGTVITSSAISSSAVDKVITVTYETAGL